jgi:murein DD-endopeptidase MepM/ murein hydrolase activator NlpD
MANRFYTIMIVPEKTARVRKLVVPSWLMRGLVAGMGFAALVSVIMVLDYWYVINQVAENKSLKMENRRLRQQVQVFRNKMTTIESTMDRVKTFATRLKVITNIEDRGSLLQSLNSGKLPDASENIDGAQASAKPTPPPENLAVDSAPSTASPQAIANGTAADPEEQELKSDYEQLDQHFSELNQQSLYVEQILQDQYELLADQKAFLAALPTRKPAVGYFTSGFGVRTSPFGGRVKMHEGVDIANQPGTPIHAPADGVVVFADSKSGYGQTVVLDHGYGLETWYGHTRKILVAKGQKVRRGDTIALLGSSGRSTGPHVHYEVRVHGTPVDPLSYILEN